MKFINSFIIASVAGILLSGTALDHRDELHELRQKFHHKDKE